MMYHNNMKMNMNAAEAKAKMRLLIIVAVVLAVGCAVLGVLMMKNSAYKTQAGQEFSRRMNGAVSSAVDEVNRMSGAAASDSMSRLARVRQYVYFMEQLNDLSMDLAGGENGRLVYTNDNDGQSIVFTDAKTKEVKTLTPPAEFEALQSRSFINLTRGIEDEYTAKIIQGLECQAVIDAALLSTEEHRPVTIAEIKENVKK